MGISHSRRRRVLALTTAATTAVALLALTGPVAANADTKPASSSIPTTVSSDSLATAQLANGVGWAQTVINGTVYVGGSFTGARAAGGSATSTSSTRSNLMAYTLSTGALTSFAPTFNGQVTALTPSADGSVLYVGGNFTTVNGTTRNHLAAINPTTGALTTWNPNVNGQVNAIAVTSSTVYIGGQFTSVSSTTRTRAAAVTTAGALTTWAPTGLDNAPKSLQISPDGTKVALGGFFSTIDGVAGAGFGIVDATTGTTLMNTPIRSVVDDGSSSSAIYGLSSDATNVYASGYYSQQSNPPTGNLEGTFAVNWNTGSTLWLNACHGDEFDSVPLNGAVYIVGHPHYCSDIPGGYPQQTLPGQTSPTYQRTIAVTAASSGINNLPVTILQPRYYDFSQFQAPSLLDWFPTLAPGTFTGAYQAAYNVITSGNYILEIGEFPTVNGSAQYGTARFALPTIAPNTDGPQLSGTTWPIYGATYTGGTARISFLANYDRDNENLTYTLYRGTTAIYTTTAASRIWYQRPTLSYTDTGVTAGSTYSYKVTATDPWGNTKTSATLSYTVPSASQGTYAKQVIADGATSYWRLGESSGTAIADTAGGLPATTHGGVTLGTAGAISGDSNTAATFDGTSGTTIATNSQTNPTNTLSVSAWFKSTATTGGEIIGAGDDQTVTTSTFTPPGGSPMTSSSDSSNHDREISTTADGHVTFTTDPGAVDTITSASGGYNDGKWHQVVGTLSSAGMVLYVDGKSAASNSAVTRGVGAEMYWRIGGDSGYSTATSTMGPPPSVPNYFTGSIDEPAAYIGTALTAAQVANQYTLAGSSSTGNSAPTASFTQSASGLTVSTDGSASTDSDGTIASYSWNWGDGTAATTGKTATHTYASAGTYSVTLTVTDNGGATGSSTQSIQVSSSTTTTPTASFTQSASGLTLSVDGTGSTDSGGTISSYAWNFGDGGTATTSTATHTYASAGTYTVTLKVTDNTGATNTATQSVTVSSGTTSSTIASDAFGRTATSSLGSADTGGAYTLTGTASRYSVNGSAAQLSTTAGSTKKAILGSTSSSDTDITATYGVSALPVGGSEYLDLIGRSVGSSYYSARVGVLASGSVNIQLTNSGSSTIKSATVSGLTYSVGDTLQIRLQAYGVNGTNLRARVWKVGTTEPSTWQVTGTDTTSALQAAGSVGFGAYLGSAVTNGPITVTIDNLLAVPTGN